MRLALPTLAFIASETVGRAFPISLQRRHKKRLDFVAKGLIVKGIPKRASALAVDNYS